MSTTTAAIALTIAGAASRRPIAPLGPRLTVAEICRVIEPLGSTILVAEPAAADLAADSGQRLGLDVHEHPTFERSRYPLELAASPNDTAAILHTSGTSGQPKPVPYPQDRLLKRTQVNGAILGFGTESVYATASPFHHIAGLGMLFVALGSGAAMCPSARFTADSWNEVIARGTTHALLVPSMIEQLLDEQRLVPGNLQCLQYGASRIDPATTRRLFDALPRVDLLQIYGQTEGSPITVLSTDDHRRAMAAADGERILGSSGRAAPGVTLSIHDADREGVGEVWARADHLMKPSADGWLRTGDLGRLDADGYLTIVGRKGDMIIRGGENVYPAEIEEVLRHHPDVAEAAVLGVPDRRLGQVVVAYVQARVPDHPPQPDELRTYARAVIAGYKVPERWEFVAELPRSSTGKVLKRLLVPDSTDSG